MAQLGEDRGPPAPDGVDSLAPSRIALAELSTPGGVPRVEDSWFVSTGAPAPARSDPRPETEPPAQDTLAYALGVGVVVVLVAAGLALGV